MIVALLVEAPYDSLIDLRERAKTEIAKVVIGQERAVEMLLASIKDGSPAASQVVPVDLIVGESTPPLTRQTPPAPRRDRTRTAAVAGRGTSRR